MLSALSHAASGLDAGFARLDRAADRIAQAGPEPEAAVDLLTARHEVAANAAVVRAADDMVGTLLDVMA
jgi:hypothetical protein